MNKNRKNLTKRLRRLYRKVGEKTSTYTPARVRREAPLRHDHNRSV